MFDFICAFLKILFDFEIPKAHYEPIKGNKFLRDLVVMFDITLDFRNPIIATTFKIIFLVFPIITVPHFPVNENSDSCSKEYNIGFAVQLFIVFTVAKSAPP